MKYAFTLVELIIVLIIVAILAISVSPLFKRDTLIPATNQVLDHIRYTQQLALNQDMFIPSSDFSIFQNSAQKTKDSSQWFKKWWQIQFHKNHSYTVYSDHPTGSTNNYEYDADADNSDEVARDPQTGLYIYKKGSSSSDYTDFERLTLVDLAEQYDVNVSMQGCGNSRHILFDGLGRPHCSKSPNGLGDPSLYPYTNIRRANYITVTLTNGNDRSLICITPITGYAYISQNQQCP